MSSTLLGQIGGAVGSLFTAQGNAAEANSYTSAAQLDQQNAQLTAASTRIQATQTARTVAQSLGTTQADVAGAGFTESGSALDILASSAQQGSLAKSLVNIQGAINENAYAAEAGANLAKAKAANEANTANTVGAIASIGGALLGSGTQLASAGLTVAKGYDYVTGLFSGGATTQTSAPITGLGQISESDLPALSSTDSSIVSGSTDIAVDDSAPSLVGETAADVSTGIGDFLSGAAATVEAGVGDAVSAAAAAAAGIGDAVVAAASAASDAISTAALALFASVICTAFYRRDMVSRTVWMGAQRYGQALNPDTYVGYIRWASPIAHQIEKRAWVAKLLAPVFIPPVNEMAYLMGYDSKRTLYGFISHRFLLGLSWVVGKMVKEDSDVYSRT